ncbi:hypothetical protein CPB86DRAFT_783504 [Serendipita vermifera]|nr:hypothetical protein CPB86DRAFT_783504 [Serendipita vermifera]
MAESAIDRTSVEIWVIILHHATTATILPFIDESYNKLGSGILQNAELFPTDGDVYADMKAIEENITNLRLVCRAWAAILASSLNRCMLTNLGAVNLPISSARSLERVKRLQIMEYQSWAGLFSFRKDISLFPHDLKAHQISHVPWWKDLDDEKVKKLLNEVRILSITNLEADPRRFLGLMPGLRAFHVFLHPGIGDIPMLFTCISRHPHLTHLSVSGVKWREFTEMFSMKGPAFPSLRYLDIKFSYYASETNLPKGQNVDWVVPQLATLILRGFVQATGDDLGPFFKKCGQTVTGLVDFGPYRSYESSFPVIPFEHHFPHLSTYGTCFSFVIEGHINRPGTNNSSILGTQIPLRLLILDGFGPIDSVGPEDAALKLGSYMRASGFSEVILIEDYFDRENYLSWRLFDDPPSPASLEHWADEFSNGFERQGFKYTYRKRA